MLSVGSDVNDAVRSSPQPTALRQPSQPLKKYHFEIFIINIQTKGHKTIVGLNSMNGKQWLRHTFLVGSMIITGFAFCGWCVVYAQSTNPTDTIYNYAGGVFSGSACQLYQNFINNNINPYNPDLNPPFSVSCANGNVTVTADFMYLPVGYSGSVSDCIDNFPCASQMSLSAGGFTFDFPAPATPFTSTPPYNVHFDFVNGSITSWYVWIGLYISSSQDLGEVRYPGFFVNDHPPMANYD